MDSQKTREERNAELNRGIIPFGLIKEGKLEMYLGGDEGGKLNLLLSEFVVGGSQYVKDRPLVDLERTDRYIDTSTFRVIDSRECPRIVGVVPEGFEVFDSREAAGEEREARVDEAYYRANDELRELLDENNVPDATVAIIVRECIAHAVTDTIHYLQDRSNKI